MKKKGLFIIFILLMLVVAVLGLTACNQEKDDDSENVGNCGMEYTLLDDDTYSVESIGECKDTEVLIPSIYEGKPVTAIGSSAFQRCSTITSVTIPDSVTSIGEYAFSDCSGLTSVAIGNGVTSIGWAAFYECSGLTSIAIPDSVTSIRGHAFDGCSGLTSITIPDSVTFIGNSAFSECEKIIVKEGGVSYVDKWAVNCDSNVLQVTLRTNTVCLADGVFGGCRALTSVVVPDSVTSIRDNVFKDCMNLQNITMPYLDGYLGSLFSANPYHPDNKTVPVSLKAVTITRGKIGDNAFKGCSGLTNVTIGNGVSYIGYCAFYNCNALSRVDYRGDIESWCAIEFGDTYANPLQHAQSFFINGINVTNEELVIPETVTKINAYAFDGWSGLTSITISDSVTSIGDNAFEFCSRLTNVTVGNSVTSIGDNAFEFCSRLTNVTIGNGVTSIGSYAFSGCSSLTGIIIPDSVTNIRDKAFYECKNLTSITIPDSATSIGDDAFYHCPIEVAILPAQAVYSIRNYKLTKVIITSGERIGNNAFSGCYTLKDVVIPSSVTSIGDYAFGKPGNSECTRLSKVDYLGDIGGWCAIEFGAGYSNPLSFAHDKDGLYINGSKPSGEITIPNEIKAIPSYTFYGCHTLTSITIPDSVTSIGNSTFHGCSSLTSIVIPDNVNFIGNSIFHGCSSLTSIVIPDNVTTIAEYAFSGCSSLKSVVIPDGAKSIGFHAFDECPIEEITMPTWAISRIQKNKLKKVIITSGKQIGKDAFRNCSNLTMISIPDSVTSIGVSAFEGCCKLMVNQGGISYVDKWVVDCARDISKVTIRTNTVGLADGAFEFCSALTSVTIPDSVTSIGSGAFEGCSGLTSITIPDSVTSIGDSAFDFCESLNQVYYQGDIGSWCTIVFGDNPLEYAKHLYINGTKVTELVIPEGVSSIGAKAFFNCSSLTSITIPDSVTSIGDEAFKGCSGLTSITIPDSVTSIGSFAFDGCNGITSIIIPNSVTYIGNAAFRECSGLTNITIPESVTSIGDEAFKGCSGLTSIVFNGTKAQWNAISKGDSWNYGTGNYTVTCTDGIVSRV